MTFKYQNQEYNVLVVRKNNKNTYIRIKNDTVYITTNYFTSNFRIKKLIEDNQKSIEKMLIRAKKRQLLDDKFLLFGSVYHIIYDNKSNLTIKDNTIYAKDEKHLNTWLNKYLKETYQKHLDYWYSKFSENIPTPNLKIRKMKTRWGVCNTKNYNITLNRELIKYDISCLDYVIVHELAHLLEANHSKQFWQIVEKYYPNYKNCRKILRT